MNEHRSRRPRAREAEGLTLGDRLGAAFVGAVIGGIVGVALAWGLGIHSNPLGSGAVALDFGHWVLGSAAGFALVGLLFGPVVGTLLGEVITAMFDFERGRWGFAELPGGWVMVLLAAGAAGMFWWLRH